MHTPVKKLPVLLTTAQMERLTGGRWRNLPTSGLDVTGINFYLPWTCPGDLFIHRKQEHANLQANDAILDKAFAQGAVAAMVLKGTLPGYRHPLLEVDNVHKALQDIGIASSLAFDGIKVLITGSHGKTGFKTQLYHVSQKQLRTHAHLDSANQQDPIFRTLSAIPKNTEVAIIEVAVPAAGKGEERSFFVRPNYCVITGIGLEHLSSHKSVKNLIHNKAAVVTGLRPGGKCILNADDPHFEDMYKAVRSYSNCEILSFGSSASCAGRLVSAEYSGLNWKVTACILGETVQYSLPLLEDYAPLASVGVMLMSRLLGCNLIESAAEFASYKNFPSSGNLYEIQLENGNFHLYDQSRRGEWKGFESMFELMSRLPARAGGRKVAVLSELINLEDNPDAPIDLERMRLLFEKAGADLLFTVHRFKEHSVIVPPSTTWLCHGNTYSEIQEPLLSSIRPNDMVFVRGIEDAKLDILVNKILSTGKSARKLY